MPDNKNPWEDQGPPEIDKIIDDFKKKFNSFFQAKKDEEGPSKNKTFKKYNKNGIKFLLIIIFFAWILSGIYIVDPAERGVVLRFGKFQKITNQGPHWRIPFPIERVYKVNVERIRAAEIGFRNDQNYGGGNVSAESLMLTKDENMVDVNLAVQYKIANAEHYLFNVVEPETTLSHVVQSVIRQVVGDNTMDYVLTTGREQVAQDVHYLSQELLDKYQSGLAIIAVTMQDAQPPIQVKGAFDDVVKAREDQQRYINEANAYANDIIPKARGTEQRVLAEAQAYKEQVIFRSDGEADRFDKILSEYLKYPEVTKERLYRETLEEVLADTSKVIVEDNSNSLMYLPIDQLIKNNKPRSSNLNNNIGDDNINTFNTNNDNNISSRSRELR